MRTLIVVALITLALCASAQCVEPVRVDAVEQTHWIRYTVPLPKSIEIAKKVVVPRSSVRLVAPKDKGIVVDQAVKELNELLGGGSGVGGAFTIALELGGEDAKPLKDLKNCEQAYLVFPDGNDRLKLVALEPAGMYYAAKTLQQLLSAKATADRVEIPLVNIIDWPDIEDRGLWGSDNHEQLRWLADRKMNWMEQISDQGVDLQTKQPYARLKGGRETLIEEAPLYAIKPVPVILHLEQSSNKGPRQVFPRIRGVSEHGGVMCYSQPRTVRIIAEWIAQLASLPHVQEVDVWMTENLGWKDEMPVKGCQCRLCVRKKVDPMVLEARAVLQAREMAEKKLGKKIGIRLLSSEATEDHNVQILSELPEDVKFVYYHSLNTYSSDKRPMMPKYLAEAAKNGRWVATCPNVAAIVGYVQPFESAQFVRYRATELVNGHASGILGYATPRVEVVRYNTEALAEYTWNLKGRSTREFAYSWAVRNGIKDPEKFADFRELIGPVHWRYNGGDWPMRATHKRLVPPLEQMLIQGKLPPFGHYIDGFVKCPFGAWSGPDQLRRDVRASAEAVKMAEEMGVEEFILESRIAQGYINALDALYELQGVIQDGKIAPDRKAEAAGLFQTYVNGFRQSIEALPKWEKLMLRPENYHGGEPKPARESTELVDRMIAAARDLGIEVQ